MTTLELTTNNETAQSAQPIYNWEEFLGNGKCKHLFSAGIINAGFKPEMLTDEGYVKPDIENKKHSIIFSVRYDKKYVCEMFCKYLKALGVIESGKVDSQLLDIVLQLVVEHTEGYANRDTEKELLKSAEEMAHKFPGIGDADHWYGILKSQLQQKKVSTPSNEMETKGRKPKAN